MAESLLRRWFLMRDDEETHLFSEIFTKELIIFVVNVANRDHQITGAVGLRPGGTREAYANHYMHTYGELVNKTIGAQSDSTQFYSSSGKIGDTSTVHDNTRFLDIVGVLNPLIVETNYRNIHVCFIEGVRRNVREKALYVKLIHRMVGTFVPFTVVFGEINSVRLPMFVI